MTNCDTAHKWAIPKFGDKSLACDCCDETRIIIDTLDPETIARMVAERTRVFGDVQPDVFTGALTAAKEVFDRLIERHPTWAETWNKRATVYFLQGRDSASISDIYLTLELEPRHFGALGGFAQICMRNGAADAARARR